MPATRWEAAPAAGRKRFACKHPPREAARCGGPPRSRTGSTAPNERSGRYIRNRRRRCASSLAREFQPTLIAVLTDISMPGIDGLELLAEIKQRFPNLPVMMVTAYGDDERRRRTRELGAFEVLPKPVDFDRLKEQLRQLPAAGMDPPGTSVARIAARRRVAVTLPAFRPCADRQEKCLRSGHGRRACSGRRWP